MYEAEHTNILSIAAALRGRGLGEHCKCGITGVRTVCPVSNLGEVAMTFVE